jgi:formate-dependent nitrite reductase cytochrome c552 subunit
MSAMDKLNEALTRLAEIVAWQGCEDHLAACERIDAGERALKSVAPDVLKRAKDAVKEWKKANEIRD